MSATSGEGQGTGQGCSLNFEATLAYIPGLSYTYSKILNKKFCLNCYTFSKTILENHDRDCISASGTGSAYERRMPPCKGILGTARGTG